jgi:hemerythrin
MNSEFQWNKSMNVGHDRIDFEHKMFLALIKNIADAYKQSKPKEFLTRLLIELERYASFHFCSEENIALEHGEQNSEFSAHHRIHEYLLKELRNRIRRHHSGEEDSMEILTFLIDWFGRHTSQDRERVARFSTDSEPDTAVRAPRSGKK